MAGKSTARGTLHCLAKTPSGIFANGGQSGASARGPRALAGRYGLPRQEEERSRPRGSTSFRLLGPLDALCGVTSKDISLISQNCDAWNRSKENITGNSNRIKIGTDI